MQKLTLCLATLLSAVVLAEPARTMPEQLNASAIFVGQLIIDETAGYYASAIVYDVSETEAFLITNAHAVPEKAELRKAFQFKGAGTYDKMVPARLIGLSPGYDVAVLAIPRDKTQFSKEKGSAEAVSLGIRRWFYRGIARETSDRGQHMAVIGAPRFWRGYDFLSVKNKQWSEEAEEVAKNGLPETTAGALSTPVHIEPTDDCPPLFLDQCYELPIRTWGFSGGALVIQAQGQDKLWAVPIAGLVSHYSPLSETTYVIPISLAIEVAERLRLFAIINTPAVEMKDPSGTFEYVSANEIKVLRGPLAGKVVERVGGPTKPGGPGESRPGSGPGESRPGGGGGDGAYYMMPEESGNTFLFGPYAKLLDGARTPEKWGTRDVFTDFVAQLFPFKGVDALLAYSPGVKVGYSTYHQLDLTSLRSLKAFINAYKKTPSDKLYYLYWPEQVPTSLEGAGYGVHTESAIRRWVRYEEVKRLSKAKIKSPFGFTDEEIETIQDNFGPPEDGTKEPESEMATHRERSSKFTPVKSAKFSRVGEYTTVDLTDFKGTKTPLAFFGKWNQKGWDFYDYRGIVIINKRAVYGVVTLQRYKGRWELKAVLAEVREAAIADPYLTDREIAVEGIYVPLK